MDRRGSWRRLGVIAGAVGLASWGGAIAGYTQGGVTPAVGGLVGGGLGLVGSAWWSRADQRQTERRGALQARDALFEMLPLRPPADLDGEAELWPSELLLVESIAAHGTIPFWGRRAELKQLREWCADPSAPRLTVLTGPTAAGKTRLSLQLAGDLPQGWVATPRR
jgi:hypothetical protein